MANHMVKANLLGLMVGVTKVNLSMDSSMERAFSINPMVANMKVNGIRAK